MVLFIDIELILTLDLLSFLPALEMFFASHLNPCYTENFNLLYSTKSYHVTLQHSSYMLAYYFQPEWKTEWTLIRWVFF